MSQVEASHQSSGGSLSPASSPSNSISLIKLDELSSFGATKSGRLPALIQMVGDQQQQQQQELHHSMPTTGAEQLERQQPQHLQTASLPASSQLDNKEDKENELGDDFQMVQMESSENLVGPSLPQAPVVAATEHQAPVAAAKSSDKDRAALLSSLGQQVNQPSHLGDSLIDMIVNLRNENQNLVRALESNNEYVKERISEFKRLNEDAHRREAQFAMEKADFEHQTRKLQRQNQVLSERLKSMEAKLSSMKLEVSDSLAAAHSSKASSVQSNPNQEQLYPELNAESFLNSALQTSATMQMDAGGQELLNGPQSSDSTTSSSSSSSASSSPSAPSAPMETDSLQAGARRVASMSKEELGKHFDATKAQFYSTDDPMKQCDQLEAQLNDIGKRDYEICLLQQQLNIYRQDYRLERMANLEAKIQIERLKADIDRLCLDRMGRELETSPKQQHQRGSHLHRAGHHRRSGSGQVRFEAATEAAIGIGGKLGHHLSKKAARQAAKYAAKAAHREEKAAAAASAATAEPSTSTEHQRHRRHSGLRAVRNEVVSDLLSTANKAMLTGYKMASTSVNLALDKLSAFEQEQAKNLAANKQSPSKPSGPPSID